MQAARVQTDQDWCAQYLSELCITAQDGIIICDNNGQIKTMNSQAEEIFGVHGEKLCGEPLERLLPALAATPSFEFARTTIFETHMVTGQHQAGGNIPLEAMRTRFDKDGAQMHLILLRPIITPESKTTAEENPLTKLSPREYQITALVVAGYTSREIAEQLTISTKTVERHRANIMYKLNTNNVVQLVRLAIDHGMG